MEKIFEILPNITSPIMLAALFLIVLLFIFKFTIGKTTKLNEDNSANLLNKIVNWILALAFVIVLLSIVGYYFDRAATSDTGSEGKKKELEQVPSNATPTPPIPSTKKDIAPKSSTTSKKSSTLTLNFSNADQLRKGNWKIKIDEDLYSITEKSSIKLPGSVMEENGTVAYELIKDGKNIINSSISFTKNKASILIPNLN